MLDYGSLIYLALQRAATAREAIGVIHELASTYGYVSTMEGFSITDGSEVWYMELIGKGPHGKGIVWVAKKVRRRRSARQSPRCISSSTETGCIFVNSTNVRFTHEVAMRTSDVNDDSRPHLPPLDSPLPQVPDGYITAHGNQGRITTFLPCDDLDTCMMSPVSHG